MPKPNLENALPLLKAMEEWETAHAVQNREGQIIALVREEAIAKKVQWAIAAQAAAKEAGIPDPTA